MLRCGRISTKYHTYDFYSSLMDSTVINLPSEKDLENAIYLDVSEIEGYTPILNRPSEPF